MTDLNQKTGDEPITNEAVYAVLQAINQKNFDEASVLIAKGLQDAGENADAETEGVFYSLEGVLHKVQGDYKKAYKSYQNAEKRLKDDPALKIITSVLLVEQFKQFDTAIRKLAKILDSVSDPAIRHQALAIQGKAYLLAGQKEAATKNLQELLTDGFDALFSAADIDFKFVATLFEKQLLKDECLRYVNMALSFAQKKNDAVYVKVFQNLLTAAGNQ